MLYACAELCYKLFNASASQMRTKSYKENKITRIRYSLTRITDVHTFFVLFAWIRPTDIFSIQAPGKYYICMYKNRRSTKNLFLA